MILRKTFVILPIILLSFYANAAEEKDLASRFRCEKFTGNGLADLKLKLIQTCDLEKPFSSSLSRTVAGGEDVYMFCCHKAKQ